MKEALLSPRNNLSRRGLLKLAAGAVTVFAAGSYVARVNGAFSSDRLASTPPYPDIPNPSLPLPEIQTLLHNNPGSHYREIYLIENIDWDNINWAAKRDHWDPIPLQGIETGSKQMWAVAFNPIEIVSGATFPVAQRACPDSPGGNYHPEFKDHVLQIWNNGQCGVAGYPGCGYDSEGQYIYAHQAFCVQ